MRYAFPLGILLILSAGCGESPVSGGLDRRVIGVRGHVRGAAGNGIAGALVTVTAKRGDCTSGVPDGDAIATTGDGGAYQTAIASSSSAGFRCVTAQASASGLQGSASLPGVDFPVRFPTDTVTVDVVVR